MGHDRVVHDHGTLRNVHDAKFTNKRDRAGCGCEQPAGQFGGVLFRMWPDVVEALSPKTTVVADGLLPSASWDVEHKSSFKKLWCGACAQLYKTLSYGLCVRQTLGNQSAERGQ
jgi:hypothetical protein